MSFGATSLVLRQKRLDALLAENEEEFAGLQEGASTFLGRKQLEKRSDVDQLEETRNPRFSFFNAGVGARGQHRARGTIRERNVRQLEGFTGAAGFKAGQGFSLQPLGFNVPLSAFQNPELFNLEDLEFGGFKVKSDKLKKRGFQFNRRTVGNRGNTLLTARIPRQKLTPGGTVKGPELAPPQLQPGASSRFTGLRGRG